jgi:AbrB family looped-hinge helix DNA binding protein
MARTLIAVNRQGRVTLPADVRRRLGIGEGSQLEVSVEDDAVRLRRAEVISGEDRWAYRPAAVASLKRALADIRAGRVYELGPRDLESGRYPRRRRRR